MADGFCKPKSSESCLIATAMPGPVRRVRRGHAAVERRRHAQLSFEKTLACPEGSEFASAHRPRQGSGMSVASKLPHPTGERRSGTVDEIGDVALAEEYL
jgi:hypothetical protein